MAYVDFWVMVDVSDDKKTGKWYGFKSVTPPEDDNNDKFAWIRIQDTDDIWIMESWNFEQGPMPKHLRGLAPHHFAFNFENNEWTHETVESVTWQNIKDERLAKLNGTDWIVVKYTELGQPIPSEWLEYRTFLRDYPDTHKHLTPEHAQHILNFTFDPELKKIRLAKGLPITAPAWEGEE